MSRCEHLPHGRPPRTGRAAVTVLLLAAVTACGFSDDQGAAAEDQDRATARVVLPFGPDTGLGLDTDDAFVLSLTGVTETLVGVGDDGELEPRLAESWERVDDLTWRVRLREDVTFHDGAALDAEAVANALDSVLSVETPPRALAGVSWDLSVDPDDPLVLQIVGAEPDPVLPSRLTAPSTAVLSPAAYEGEGTPSVIGTGTGAFQLLQESDIDGSRALVRAFDGHWAGPPALAGATVSFVPDPGARLAALRADEADIAEALPSTAVQELEGLEDVTVDTVILPRTTGLHLNTQDGALSDPAVRRALAQAVDREELAATLGAGAAPAQGWFGPSVPYGVEDLGTAVDVPTYDPDAARAELERLVPGGLSLSLWTYDSRPELPDLATAVAGQLEQIGVDVDLLVQDYNQLEPRVLAGEHDMFLLSRGFLVDTHDAAAYLASDLSCDGSYNLDRFCDERLDEVLVERQALDSPEQRATAFSDLDELLVDETVGIPVLHDQLVVASTDAVSGYVPDPNGQILLTGELAVSTG